MVVRPWIALGVHQSPLPPQTSSLPVVMAVPSTADRSSASWHATVVAPRYHMVVVPRC